MVGQAIKEYIIQLTLPNAYEQNFLFMNIFVKALSSDPCLASFNRNKLATIFQILRVCAGGNHISYFKSLGKETSLKYSTSIITGKQTPGHFHKTESSFHIDLTQS